VRGALSIAACARKQGIRNLIVPADNAAEAAVAEGVNVYAIHSLAEAVKYLANPSQFHPVKPTQRGRARQAVTPFRTSRTCAGKVG